MGPSKFISMLVLFVGVICILVALGGLGMRFLGGETPEKIERQLPSLPPAAKNVQERKPEPVSPDTVSRALTQAEIQRMATRVLLERIAATPDQLDRGWLAGICQYIGDEGALQSYYGELLAQGAQWAIEYGERQKKAKKTVSTDPRFFISLARQEIYDGSPSKRRLERDGVKNLGLALLREKEAQQGLENIDEEFMGSFFKELMALYRVRRELAVQSGEDLQPWVVEQIKAFEAALMDRYLRMAHQEEAIRQKRTGTQASAAPDLRYVDLLRKNLDQDLLGLGRLYLEVAERETRDREKLRFHAERAFAILAMLYQRTHSSEALAGIRSVNEIQRTYLHRMAQTSWKRAQLTAADGDRQQTAENYFRATQFYNECMAKAVGLEKEEIAAEFLRLKQEIAAWHAQKTKGPVREEGGI